MAAKNSEHPLKKARRAELEIIRRITNRAVHLYADHKILMEPATVLMDISACHFHGQGLRLDELLAANDANFLHDIAGINRHLDRETYELRDGFSPRFAQRHAA